MDPLTVLPGIAQAFWITAPGHGELRTEQLSPPQEGEVQVESLYSGISRGTESLVFRGLVPDSEFDRMRAPFQRGNFPGPLTYGYATVGRVARGPAPLEDRDVFVLHPHQSHFNVPVDMVHPLPPGVPAKRAVLAASLETALNGLWDARPHVGDRIAVVGAGVVGCLVAWLARQIVGCTVELIDQNPSRATVAGALGVPFAHVDSPTPDADLVVHASGSPSGLSLALQLAAYESRVVELSWYGRSPVPLALGESFHSRRLRLVSSQVGAVAPSQRSRWDRRRRMTLALRLLANAELDALITDESAFADLPEVMARLAAAPGDTLCHRIRYA